MPGKRLSFGRSSRITSSAESLRWLSGFRTMMLRKPALEPAVPLPPWIWPNTPSTLGSALMTRETSSRYLIHLFGRGAVLRLDLAGEPPAIVRWQEVLLHDGEQPPLARIESDEQRAG